ncbi:Membrane proteinase PrsW, cleaves anti-sigma factor RsiW, M82 family [Amycolatopsis marina]|uniref:Membrane proteinase PrsW, cleaves anti-sigma factor RsiW, M82 family n=1 Tax=Amycolatopsis marina TaxID=490629 RepID=A0A1I0Y9I0_9PSEU|nr:PrsW family intramembrane metalloprotease [Amycolatopsis marina]SFB08833.1 Membrane proteinase PrsW, cleaves anti-sigma factor RsiW, M82 family [Amycolatopsis marina]
MLLPVLGLVLVALCGLLVLGLATARVGVLATVIGVLAAVVPVALVVAAFLWIDRWEPEPAKLLLLSFCWGAFVATLTALLINDTASAVGDMLLGTGNGDKFSAVVSAPLVEEAVKALPVLAVLLRRSHEFDGLVDGIVYAGFSAAGFAFTENIYYFGRAFAEYGFGDATSAGVLTAFILRGVLSPFAHPLFTVLTGIGIGVAARTASKHVRVLAPLGGYLGAVGLHALWNASATLGGATTFLNVYFLIMVPMFIGLLLLVLWQRRREQRIVAAALPEMAEARWIARSEMELLASLTGRRRWRRQARRESGRAAGRAVGAYQASVTELAFLRRNLACGNAELEGNRRHAELLAVLRSVRAEAVRLAGGGHRSAAHVPHEG